MTKEEYKDVVRSCRDKIRKAKALLELNLISAMKGKKSVFVNTLTTERRPKRIPIFFWMQREQQQRLRKRLRCLMPSLSQSLTVKLNILRAAGPLSW